MGFSWPAFFFGFFWMVVEKIWLYAGVWFALYVVLSAIESLVFLQHYSESNLTGAILLLGAYTAAWLIPGFKDNGWRESILGNRGCRKIASIEAATPDTAIAHVLRTPTQSAEISP